MVVKRYIFLNESSNIVENEVIREITWKEYKAIEDIIKGVKEKDLSFGDTFGDKKRIMIPFKSGDSEKSEIQKFIEFFDNNGYDLDFKTGMASKEFEIPAGPKRGQKQKRSVKIGKLTQKLNDLYDSYAQKVGGGGTPEGKKAWDNLAKTFPYFAENWSELEHKEILDFKDFWNKKSEFYRKHPEDVGKEKDKYSIIISRHPVDVLRMSDFTNITSCHSPRSRGAGSHYHCAVAEAQGHGLVAYVVENDEIPEGFDLDKDEIFADARREVAGVTPVSRVRLRKFVGGEDAYEIAVPERRVYGKRIPGFVDAVVEWARKQKSFKDLKEEEPMLADLDRYGGSYSDNYDGTILNQLLGKDLYKDYGETNHVGDDEEENMANQYEEECQQIQETADGRLNHAHIYYEIEDMEEQVYVMFGGGLDITFPDELFSEEFPSDWRERSKVSRELESAINNADVYGIEELEIEEYGNEVSVRIRAHTGDYEPTPNGFDAFASAVEDLDNDYPKIARVVKNFFIEEGYMEPSEHYKKRQDIKGLEDAGDRMLKNFEVGVDDEAEIEISNEKPIYIDLKGYDATYPNLMLKVFTDTKENFLIDLANKEAQIRMTALKQMDLPGIDIEKPKKFVPNIDHIEIEIYISSDKIEQRGTKFGRGVKIPEGLGVTEVKITVPESKEDEHVLSAFAYAKFMDDRYELIQKFLQDSYNRSVQEHNLKPGGKRESVDITAEYERQAKKDAENITRQAVSGRAGGASDIGDYKEYTKSVKYMYFDLGRVVFLNEIAGGIVGYLQTSDRWHRANDIMYSFVKNFFKAFFVQLKRQIKTQHKEVQYLIFNLYKMSQDLLDNDQSAYPIWDAVAELGMGKKHRVTNNEVLFKQYPELKEYIKTHVGTYIVPIEDIKESKKVINNMVVESIVDELVKNTKISELVKLMKPLEVAKVIAVSLDLQPEQACETALNLIKYAEGISAPGIEFNKQYPVPPTMKKDKPKLLKFAKDEAFLHTPGTKVDITPKFVITRHHFPPDPYSKEDDWPYDDMTVAGMNSKNKSRKKSLTTAKDNSDTRSWKQKGNPLNPDMKIRQPAGDGAGGGGVYSITFHSKTGDMPGAGNKSWVAKGTKGWNSMPGAEFDNPDAENDQPRDKKIKPPTEAMGGGSRNVNPKSLNAGDEDDEMPSFMKNPPVGSSIPTANYGGRVPKGNLGWRGPRRR
jgi:hypothetical protein